MKGDFSRITFDAAHHFSRVLMQQGRVTIDADANEQAAILLHYLRTLASDLIGPCGGPVDALGFQLGASSTGSPATWTVTIQKGRYYVDGILCENAAPCSYTSQPDYPLGPKDRLSVELTRQVSSTQGFWLYLDVWERHITPIEDGGIREVALGGPDTCTRSKVIWQVKALSAEELVARGINIKDIDIKKPDACKVPLQVLSAISSGRLAAELDPGKQIKDPCIVAPDARYRGAENQLYRVEIHRGNLAPDGAIDPSVTPTFKWSRDNASVATAWLGTKGNDLVVASARGFSAGAWVELSDDGTDLRGEPGALVRLTSVDGDRLTVDPGSLPAPDAIAWTASLSHPKVRRWDQSENDDITLDHGAIPIVEATTADPHWIALEDGLRVQFGAGTALQGTPGKDPGAGPKLAGPYRTGDYWLIPARVATGDIEWPRTGSTAELRPPHGVVHHHAPLGWLSWETVQTTAGTTSQGWVARSCLCTFTKLGQCGDPAAAAGTAPAPTGTPPASTPPTGGKTP